MSLADVNNAAVKPRDGDDLVVQEYVGPLPREEAVATGPEPRYTPRA